MRRIGFIASVLVGVVVLLGFATPTDAEVSPPGSCTGSAAFTKGTKAAGPFTVRADVPAGKVIEVPLGDTVKWEGAVVGPAPGVERSISGFVAVDLPWPLGHQNIDSWCGKSKKVGNSGTKKYDLPSSVPRGVEFNVTGEHHEGGKLFCSGHATVKLEGGAFDSFATPAALFLTVVSAAGLVLTGIAGRKV